MIRQNITKSRTFNPHSSHYRREDEQDNGREENDILNGNLKKSRTYKISSDEAEQNNVTTHIVVASAIEDHPESLLPLAPAELIFPDIESRPTTAEEQASGLSLQQQHQPPEKKNHSSIQKSSLLGKTFKLSSTILQKFTGPIHPRCDHISFACLTLALLVFVGMAILIEFSLFTDIDMNGSDGIPPPVSISSPSSDGNNIQAPSSNYANVNTTLSITSPSVPDTSPSPSLFASTLPTIQASSEKPSLFTSTEPTIHDSSVPSSYVSPTPSQLPSNSRPMVRNETEYSEKKIVPSDGEEMSYFGRSCSIAGDLFVVGSFMHGGSGAAYLYNVGGIEKKKLTVGNDGSENDLFGVTVSMEKKIVVGSNSNYVRVFSRSGEYERTIKCTECRYFGHSVATHGNIMLIDGFLYSSITGRLLKVLHNEWVNSASISEDYIVTSTDTRTIVYSRSGESSQISEIADISQRGWSVALVGDKILIGDYTANKNDGAVYLYKTDGTFIQELDRRDSTRGSHFGWSVAMTDEKVLVGAFRDSVTGYETGAVYIYSSISGEFEEKKVAHDADFWDYFGGSVCASNNFYVAGAYGVNHDNKRDSGAVYMFPFSE